MSFLDSYAEQIRKTMVRALADYQMIDEGDRVLAAVSGGKDSSVMVLQLEEIRKKSPISFELEAVLVDQKQPGFNAEAFSSWMKNRGIKLTIIEEDTYSIVVEKTEKGKSYCGLCSRLRRGILYTYASKHGFSKIALGHHRDDLNATILMNMFYSGAIASMPPKLRSEDSRNTLIRPMCYVAEKDIVSYAKELRFPIIPCNLCGSQDGLKRQYVKKILNDVEKQHGELGATLLAAQQNIKPSQLGDRRLWQF